MRILDEFHNHDVVIMRLKRMKEDVQKKEQKRDRDPFKQTFLERIREALGCGAESRQHVIKAKLRWFAGSGSRREELEQEIDRKFKNSGGFRIELHTAQSSEQDALASMVSIDFNAEFAQMMAEAEELGVSRNDLDFSVEAASADLILSDGSTESTLLLIVDQSDEPGCDELELETKSTAASVSLPPESTEDGKGAPAKTGARTKKTTSELFLSTSEFAQEKGKTVFEQSFASTILWAQSDDYMPGEKWNPETTFKPLADSKIGDNEQGFVGETSSIIGMLLVNHDPSMLVAEGI